MNEISVKLSRRSIKLLLQRCQVLQSIMLQSICIINLFSDSIYWWLQQRNQVGGEGGGGGQMGVK